MKKRYKATCTNGQGIASLETGQVYLVEFSSKSENHLNLFSNKNSKVPWGTFEEDIFDIGESVSMDQQENSHEEIEINNFDFKDGGIDFEITPEGHEQILLFKI